MSTTWFVRLEDGRVSGPYSEPQIRNGISDGRINDPMRVRQGSSGWIRVAKVRALFEGLTSEGLFVRVGDRVLGPFTRERLEQIKPELPERFWVREGCRGEWQLVAPAIDSPAIDSPAIDSPASPMEKVAQMPLVDLVKDPELPQNVAEPLARPIIPAAPVMKLRSPTWKHAVEGAYERVGNLFLGDPLITN